MPSSLGRLSFYVGMKQRRERMDRSHRAFGVTAADSKRGALYVIVNFFGPGLRRAELALSHDELRQRHDDDLLRLQGPAHYVLSLRSRTTEFCQFAPQGLDLVPEFLEFLKASDDLCVQAALRSLREIFVVRAHLYRHAQGIRGLLFRFHPLIIDSF